MKAHVFVFILLFSSYPAFATGVDVSTDKYTYNYGDHLKVIITVPAVSDDSATMYIIGPDGVKSTPIPVRISSEVTTITTPNSFVPSIFKEGTYVVEVQYGDGSSRAEFEIVDSGSLFLPIGGSAVISQWAGGALSDHSLIKYLTDNNTISLTDGLSQTVRIPYWYKVNAVWWLEQRITDADFINALQYMIDEKVVR